MVIFISNDGFKQKILSHIKFHDNAIKRHLKEKNISHYLFTYDLVEYNFKDIYQSFNVSYFSKKTSLNEDFIDSEELKDYEQIEDLKKNKISIIIKKFKLRISIAKIIKFSDEIIISDDYDFDVTTLSHFDSLIKIAIVRDDLENWLSSGNLDNYDIVFTTQKEYMDSLKKSISKIHIVHGNTIYLEFKNILNFLFRNNNKKFYYFMHNRFNKVFPKYKNYFKVLDSEYFNDQWYKQEYDIADNTDSAVHFLLVGHQKGYDPSPEFSISEYYTCNPDVESKGMNALIHYELHGKKENRMIHISEMNERNHSLIQNSIYFDKEWYRHSYDIPENKDCADHYLNIGYMKGYNPGPKFSTFEYYNLNGDVKLSKMNPLLHYELKGKEENRTISFTDEEHQEHYQFIVNSPYFDEKWYRNSYNIPEDIDCVDHYLNVGYARSYNPGPEFSTSKYYECNEDVERYGMNPLLHYEKFGRDEGRNIHVDDLRNE